MFSISLLPKAKHYSTRKWISTLDEHGLARCNPKRCLTPWPFSEFPGRIWWICKILHFGQGPEAWHNEMTKLGTVSALARQRDMWNLTGHPAWVKSLSIFLHLFWSLKTQQNAQHKDAQFARTSLSKSLKTAIFASCYSNIFRPEQDTPLATRLSFRQVPLQYSHLCLICEGFWILK